MPLNDKGKKIMRSMKRQYGSEKKAEQVFYASKNAGKVEGVERTGRHQTRRHYMKMGERPK